MKYLCNAIPFGSTIITPIGLGIATTQGLVNTLKKTPADIVVLMPSIVADLSRDTELLGYCASHVQMMVYIGGDIPQAVGDRGKSDANKYLH
jgi:hypothetical protein